jgi:hypothetical protein
MANILIYKIMFNPTVGKLFEIYQYFKTFSCNVRVSNNKDKRLIDSHSYIGLCHWVYTNMMRYIYVLIVI